MTTVAIDNDDDDDDGGGRRGSLGSSKTVGGIGG